MATPQEAPSPDEPAEVGARADAAPADAGAETTETALKTPLEKPLCELTEEDIALVTREDCRRFLKEKGMRRPSWNKSQAIQQVISLKALLEGRQDADDDSPSATASTSSTSIPAVFPRRPPDSQFPVTTTQVSIPSSPISSPPPRSVEPQISAAGCSLSPCQRRDPLLAISPAVDAGSRLPTGVGATDLLPCTTRLPPRPTGAVRKGSPGQLTIFYDDRVSVYDDVSPEKARMIMEIAASPRGYDLPPLPPLSPSPNRQLQCRELAARLPPPLVPGGPLQCPKVASPRAGSGGGWFGPPLVMMPPLAPPPAPPMVFTQTPHSCSTGRFVQHFRESSEEQRGSREVELESSTGRAASVQRYLERRKDRFKFKRHAICSPSAVEMCLGEKMRDQMPNEQLSYSEIGSIHQAPRPPMTPTRCNSTENSTQNCRIPIDLNDDVMSLPDTQEASEFSYGDAPSDHVG